MFAYSCDLFWTHLLPTAIYHLLTSYRFLIQTAVFQDFLTSILYIYGIIAGWNPSLPPFQCVTKPTSTSFTLSCPFLFRFFVACSFPLCITYLTSFRIFVLCPLFVMTTYLPCFLWDLSWLPVLHFAGFHAYFLPCFLMIPCLAFCLAFYRFRACFLPCFLPGYFLTSFLAF